MEIWESVQFQDKHQEKCAGYYYHLVSALIHLYFNAAWIKILPGTDEVLWYLDEILVTVEDLKIQDEILRETIVYKLLRTRITYLEHKIDTYGLHPIGEHVDAIKQSLPQNSIQLRSFLQSITYYRRFIDKYKCVPLQRYLKKHAK